MKRTIYSVATLLLLLLTATMAWGQRLSATDQLKADPRKAYGTDYPYQVVDYKMTAAPKGYTPFYISHYGRHGSRYYWNATLYREVDTLLTRAHKNHQLTPVGEAFYEKYTACSEELRNGVSELSEVGWQQHQNIARKMYNSFPEVFQNGGNVLAISSLQGRCVISMAGFCQELVQCNPKIEIREQSSRFTLDGVVPTDGQNPVKHNYARNVKPRYEQNRDKLKIDEVLRGKIIERMFTNTEGLPGNLHHISSNMINLYTSLPSIGHEGMMEGIITDEEIAAEWERDNLGSYSWVFGPQWQTVPVLQDIIRKADAKLDGSNDRIADLRFGHDTVLGPLTVLMGLNGADIDPEDPFEVKNCYQNWETCKASNLQLIFYRSKKQGDDILVKCLLNGEEATLPVPTNNFPYYKYSDFRQFYTARCDNAPTAK